MKWNRLMMGQRTGTNSSLGFMSIISQTYLRSDIGVS